jgi:hypothetical protein
MFYRKWLGASSERITLYKTSHSYLQWLGSINTRKPIIDLVTLFYILVQAFLSKVAFFQGYFIAGIISSFNVK